MASESMSDDTSEVWGEGENVPVSSASSISNDVASEPATIMSETEDSNSYVEPSSSETDSYQGAGGYTHTLSGDDVWGCDGSVDLARQPEAWVDHCRSQQQVEASSSLVADSQEC